MRYTELSINRPEDLIFGTAPRPVTTRRGLKIGDGTVYPELNFTLPPMTVNAESMVTVRKQYRAMIASALSRAEELHAPGLVVELETVPPLTENPEWGLEVATILQEALEAAPFATALRVTPNDNREFARPPVLRSGRYWEGMQRLFRSASEAGADLVSIESVGGKEIHDEALLMGDLPMVIFAQCVLGARDMEFLWKSIVSLTEGTDAVAAGDTACGFANTALALSEQKMIPRVFAAVVRCVSAVRSLVAYECGARGPGKDCGYENVILKAITGCPMSMEGKTAACAHFSPMGNIAAAACDLWSNESVQNIKLLSGMAPTAYLEQLIYDCRLMNRARAEGPEAALSLQRWLVESDEALDPQAFVLAPANSIEIARAIVREETHYASGVAAARCCVSLMRSAVDAGRLRVSERETTWLGTMQEALDGLPEDEDAFIARCEPQIDPKLCLLKEYGL